jgi:uncharacterized membrane protein
MKKLIKRISVLLGLLGFLILPYFVFAASPLNALKTVGNEAGYAAANETTVSSIVGSVIAAVLGLLGVIFVCLIIYAGITWMTSGGDEAKVEKAQKILRSAIIGLILTVSVYAIYQVVNLLMYQTLV